MDNFRKRILSSSSSNTPSDKVHLSGSSSVAKRRSPAHPDVLAFGFNTAANTKSVTPSHVVPASASKVTMESGKDNDSDDADDFVHDKNWHQRSVAVQQGKKTQPFSQPSSRDQSASSVVTTKKSQPTAASKAKVGGGQSLVVGNRRAPRPPDQSASAFDLKSIASEKHPHLEPLDLHDSDSGQSSQQQPIKEKAKKSRTELGLNVSAQIATRPPATETPAKGSSKGNSSKKTSVVGGAESLTIHSAAASLQASKLSGSRESTSNSGGGHGKRKGPTSMLTITNVQINSSATDDSSGHRDNSSPVAEEPAKKKARLSSSGESVHSLDKQLAAPTPGQKPVGIISANRRLSTSTAPVSPRQQPQQQNMSETLPDSPEAADVVDQAIHPLVAANVKAKNQGKMKKDTKAKDLRSKANKRQRRRETVSSQSTYVSNTTVDDTDDDPDYSNDDQVFGNNGSSASEADSKGHQEDGRKQKKKKVEVVESGGHGDSDTMVKGNNKKKKRQLESSVEGAKQQKTRQPSAVPTVADQPPTSSTKAQSTAAQPGTLSDVVGKKKRKHKKKKRNLSVAESVQTGDGGGSQPLSLVSGTSSQSSTKSQVEKTRRLDQLLEKYSNVVQAVDKDENSHIPNDQLIQDRLISYFAKELAEVEDAEDEEDIGQGDAVTRAAVKDVVDRMSQESLKNDPGRLVLLNSFSNSTVSRKMFNGFRKWLKYCKETGRDYKVFDKDSALAFLLWLKQQTFKIRGDTKPQHYSGTAIEGAMVSAYTMLRVGGYYKADQRLKDILGQMSFVAARYCRRNIGTDKQNRAQITLIPDEIDLLSLQLPFDTPGAVQNMLFVHMTSNLGLRPSSLLRGRPTDNPNQPGLLVKDISFKRDDNLRLRMTVRLRFFKDVVDRGQFKDQVVKERDSPFCLVRLTLLQLMLMGCVTFTSPNFMRDGEIQVRPPRDNITLFCATDFNDCLLVGMPMYKDETIWKGLARTVGLPEKGLSARSCRRGFVTATALSLVSDDVDSTTEKLLQLLRSLNMWRGNAALSYIEQDLYWLTNVAEKLHPNQPVSYKALPARLVWQYAYHRCIDKDEYEDPTDPEMKEKVKASPYFQSTLQETIAEKKKKKEPIDLVQIKSDVLRSCCRFLANESNRKGYDDKAAEITVKPLPEMPLEVLDVELVAQKLKGTHVENLSFLFRAGLSKDTETCPADVVCEAIGCNKRFGVTGDYEKHRTEHADAKHKFTCKVAQCPTTKKQRKTKEHEMSAVIQITHAHRNHYRNRTCDSCGNRCSNRKMCQRATCEGSTSSNVPFFIAAFLGMRKVVTNEGNIRSALEAVDKVKICDDVAGSAIQSYPLLPMVPVRRRLDQLKGTPEGDQYDMYADNVKGFNQTLKMLEFRRKAVEESKQLMDNKDCDSD